MFAQTAVYCYTDSVSNIFWCHIIDGERAVWAYLINTKYIFISGYSVDKVIDSDWRQVFPVLIINDGTVQWRICAKFSRYCEISMCALAREYKILDSIYYIWDRETNGDPNVFSYIDNGSVKRVRKSLKRVRFRYIVIIFLWNFHERHPIARYGV